jgi:hypothetical protein
VTAKELRDALEKTGTGARFLAPIDDLLRDDRGASGEEAFEALKNSPDKVINNPISKPLPDGRLKPFALSPTLAKARHLLDGKPAEDLFGKPPQSTVAEEMNRELARVALKMAEKTEEGKVIAQARGLGVPQKPVVAK